MIKIHREVFGQGPVLVMIHGWSMHSGVWRPMAEQLGRHFKVICLDLPGHGHSESCLPYHLQTIGDALLEAISDEQFTLLGWSLGATVVIDIAYRHPQRVEKLILLAGNPCFVEQADWPGVRANVLQIFQENLLDRWQQTLARFLALQVIGLPEGKKMLKQLKEALNEAPWPSQEALKGGLAILNEMDLRAPFKDLKQPVLAFFAEQDNLIPVSCMNAVKQLKPAIETHLLTSAGHAPFFSHALEIESAIWRFHDANAQ